MGVQILFGTPQIQMNYAINWKHPSRLNEIDEFFSIGCFSKGWSQSTFSRIQFPEHKNGYKLILDTLGTKPRVILRETRRFEINCTDRTCIRVRLPKMMIEVDHFQKLNYKPLKDKNSLRIPQDLNQRSF